MQSSISSLKDLRRQTRSCLPSYRFAWARCHPQIQEHGQRGSRDVKSEGRKLVVEFALAVLFVLLRSYEMQSISLRYGLELVELALSVCIVPAASQLLSGFASHETLSAAQFSDHFVCTLKQYVKIWLLAWLSPPPPRQRDCSSGLKFSAAKTSPPPLSLSHLHSAAPTHIQT